MSGTDHQARKEKSLVHNYKSFLLLPLLDSAESQRSGVVSVRGDLENGGNKESSCSLASIVVESCHQALAKKGWIPSVCSRSPCLTHKMT